MKFNELDISPERKRTRVGRGISAGKGKTAGRGTKGQLSRAGSGRRPGFEGGQNALMTRIPKLRGFTQFREKPITVTTAQLNAFKGSVDNFTLYQARILKRPDQKARVVVKGEITAKVDVKLQGASKTAIEAIKKAGGSFQQVDRPQATAKSDDK